METKLKELGLTDEQVKKAQEILKEEINGKYIPKERFDQVNNDAKATKAKLEELQKSNPEELNAKIKQLTDDLEKKNQEYLAKERDLLIDNQLSKAGVRNIKALKALLDMDKVNIQDGNVTGLEGQIKALKDSDSYLFNDVNSTFGKKPDDSGRREPMSGAEEAFFRMNPTLKEK